MNARLLTAKQVAETFGLPSATTLRSMRQQGLPAVKIGKAWLFEAADVDAFIQSRKVTACPAQISVPGSNMSTDAARSTSSGMKGAESAPAALARQTVERLKLRLPGSSASVSSLNGR